MALEDLTGSAKYVSALNPAWPVDDDWVDEGDNHIRGIKNVLKNTFPGWNGAQGLFPDGTGFNPGIGWINAASSGFHHIGSGAMEYNVVGQPVFSVNAAQVVVGGGAGFVAQNASTLNGALSAQVGTFNGFLTAANGLSAAVNSTVNYAFNATNSATVTPNGVGVSFPGLSVGSQGSHFILAGHAGGNMFAVWTNGGIGNFQANNVNVSDAGVKSNIADGVDYTSFVGQLAYRQFEYGDGGGVVDGLIAQEVGALDGSLVTVALGQLGIYEHRLQQRINSVIPRLLARVEALEARVAVLEGKSAGH